MYKHNVLGYWSGLALCLTKVRSSRARCPATAPEISRTPDSASWDEKTRARMHNSAKK